MARQILNDVNVVAQLSTVGHMILVRMSVLNAQRRETDIKMQQPLLTNSVGVHIIALIHDNKVNNNIGQD